LILSDRLLVLTAPAVDYRPLADALTNIVPEIDELRLDVEDDQPFTDRVHELIGAIWLTFYALSTLLAHLLLTFTSLFGTDIRIAPPITDIYRTLEQHQLQHEAFAALVTGRLDKLDSELSLTKQQLHNERVERKREHAALKSRVLRAESAITEKAEQQVRVSSRFSLAFLSRFLSR